MRLNYCAATVLMHIDPAEPASTPVRRSDTARHVASRWLTGVAIGVFTASAAAHHSPASFDLSQEVVLEGTVKSFSWRNPHVYIELDMVGPDGTTTTQQIEAGPAQVFVAGGFDSSMLRPGERLIVRARPNRGGPGRVVLGWQLTKADGTVVPLHARAMAPTAASAVEATSIAGTWVPQGTGFASLAIAARTWPLTEKGRAAVLETREARTAARAACVPYGPPALMAIPAAAVVEVGGSEIVFTMDAKDARRVVHLDRRDHPASVEPTVLGDSVGWWEGNTLVVETTNFSAQPEGYAFDLPSSEKKRVVERFSLNADRKHLDYEATFEDPEYFATPITHRSQWDYRPNLKPANLPCDPESAGRFATED